MKPDQIDTQAAEIREWAKQEFSRLRRSIGQLTKRKSKPVDIGNGEHVR